MKKLFPWQNPELSSNIEEALAEIDQCLAGLGWEDLHVPILMQAPGISIFTPLSFCT